MLCDTRNPLLELPGIRVGRAGVEKHHEPVLRGRAGAVQLEVNAVGRVIRRAATLHASARRALPDDDAARLAGRRVVAVQRLGKHQALTLDDGSTPGPAAAASSATTSRASRGRSCSGPPSVSRSCARPASARTGRSGRPPR